MNTVDVIHLSPANYDRWVPSLAGAYVRCFSQPPWHEVFDPQAVENRLRHAATLDDAVFLAAVRAHQPLGATLFYPLQYQAAVSALVGLDHAMYCDELFVTPDHQRQGIGSWLFDAATRITIAKGYHQRVLRTSVHAQGLKRFYASRGYRAVAYMQCASLKRLEGCTKVVDDTRVVMMQGDCHAG